MKKKENLQCQIEARELWNKNFRCTDGNRYTISYLFKDAANHEIKSKKSWNN